MPTVLRQATSIFGGLALALLFMDSLCAAGAREALLAIEAMRLIIKEGDRASVKIRSTSVRKGIKDPFEMRFSYIVSETLPADSADGGGGYIVDMGLEYAGKPNHTSPPGFDEWVRRVFPPMRIKLDANFDPVDILNWEEVQRTQKQALKRFAEVDRLIQMMIIPMAMFATNEELMLDMFRPISSFQRGKWASENGSFRKRIMKKNGAVTISGWQKITPVEVSGTQVRLGIETEYDTEDINKNLNRSALGKLVNKKRSDQGLPENALDMTMSSKGEAFVNLRTGWFEKSREVLTVSMQNPSKTTAPRLEIIEIEQTRVEP